MSFLRKQIQETKSLVKVTRQPELNNPPLIAGWGLDAGRLGSGIVDYLSGKLGGELFAEIEPVEFFPLAGVAVESDMIRFPESVFLAADKSNLMLFRSDPPAYEWHKFMNLMLSFASADCHVREIYTLGGMVSMQPHTMPRELTGVFNSPKAKEALFTADVSDDLDYETPPGQRPTLNSFMLWTAREKNIIGMNIWVTTPFYLIAAGDSRAKKKVAEYFNQKFNLGMDLSDLDAEITRQEDSLTRMRTSSTVADECIHKLEDNQGLTDEESQKLVAEVDKFLD